MFRHARTALFFLVLGMALLPAALGQLAQGGRAPVTRLIIDGAIGPANADYVARGIARAASGGSQLVVLQIDTPGGLDTSMRVIIRAILGSPVPVASYVAPGGARAASAGTYIVYASHIAAMAPGTNLGAATPVQVSAPDLQPGAPRRQPEPAEPKSAAEGPLTSKHVNDAAAYIRGLAQLRGRNPEWAERSVREALSLSAEEALKLRVIDLIAPDIDSLLAQLEGRKVTAMGQEKRLQASGAALLEVRPDWRSRLLTAITNPSIALLLMSVGIYGLLFEFMSPGAVAPGVIGAISLLLGLYALQLLPVNYAGLGLILLGMTFMVAEGFLPSFGIIGMGGVAAFVAGALILVDTDVPGYGIPPGLIAGVALVSFALVAGTVTVALKTRRRGVSSGAERLIGRSARVLDDAAGEGWALVDGETWRVASAVPLRRGQQVRIVGRSGLLLRVVPEDNQKGERA